MTPLCNNWPSQPLHMTQPCGLGLLCVLSFTVFVENVGLGMQ